MGLSGWSITHNVLMFFLYDVNGENMKFNNWIDEVWFRALLLITKILIYQQCLTFKPIQDKK